ncbi:hypothetical protein D2T29_22365 [Sinirhodobacter populi]|uniref:Terminase large subunit n=1 Tax=Paenirhodobacter populi TaxID=2306993 RepID=A0A443JXA9_9RHOB|nr:hypothetical protein [Sinirhodobacter populi]RWR25106.1 hypothetical protein D2T29_22365 [Sinirhodobacter populi]
MRVFLFIPRGNRKTSLAAALSLLHLIGPEKVSGGKLVFAACDKRHAGIAFKEPANTVRLDSRLAQVTKITDQRNAAK